LDFFVQLDRTSADSLHGQLEERVRAAIRSGRMKAGTELPSTRSLASELGTSRGVVVEAYSQLQAEGYLAIDARSKTRVAAVFPSPEQAAGSMRGQGDSIDWDFHPGLPDLVGFPRASWSRALRNALSEIPAAGLSYEELAGSPALREALALHLSRARGAFADADRMLITQGFSEGLALVCQAIRARGMRKVAVEDPCHPIHRAIITEAGLEAVPIGVDEDGMMVAELERDAIDVALLTPAHQFPMGAVLAPARRRQLLDWAQSRSAYVIEDDYDAEYRYDRDPVGTLQGLAPERVIYGGSASKTLAPGLRLGWLAIPEQLFGAVLERKALAGASPAISQLALADWISSGEFHRHLRRMRLRYRKRRAAMIDSLRAHLPGARLQGIAAGLHVVVELRGGADEQQLVSSARERGVSIHPLGWHRAEPASAEAGLVLGYGSLGEAGIARGVCEIARALESI
jgi:GntR family transcriptional regulator / MocR family aminotransferase